MVVGENSPIPKCISRWIVSFVFRFLGSKEKKSIVGEPMKFPVDTRLFFSTPFCKNLGKL